MEHIKSAKDLEDRITVAVDDKGSPPSLDGVQRNVTAIMSAWPSDKGLYLQLKRLASFIEQTKSEIAALRPDEVKQTFLPKATDELDAIVAATADASTRIMDAADVLMDIAGRLPPEDADRAMNAVTSIFEACSFQDITGQRITKVVNTLKVIERRVDQMICSSGLESFDASAFVGDMLPAADSAQDEPTDRDLLNGPALPGQAKTQEEIDALLGFA
jgi:chemotaxis protein CheZ